MIFFWTLFDAMVAYVTPLLIGKYGFSTSAIGFIIASSSITGALFDFLICKIFTNINFRRVFLFMFLLCSIYPLILWQANGLLLFLLGMAVWGIYYDLYAFGTFNFIGRFTAAQDHSTSFGLVQTFRSLGAFIAPLIVGLLIAEHIGLQLFAWSWLFLAISFIFFLILISFVKRRNPSVHEELRRHPRRKNLLVEIHLWKKLGHRMLPVLLLTFFLFFVEAFFWTLGPLYSETTDGGGHGGWFISAYLLPALLVGWYIGPLTKKFGKKKTAFVSLMIGSSILATFALWQSSLMVVVITFIASCFMSAALPAIDAAYADYIAEAPPVEGEIEGLEDLAFNAGYIFGPISAGLLGDIISIPVAFSILGIIGVVWSIVLYAITPKHINLKNTQ
jgi:MFS family permease